MSILELLTKLKAKSITVELENNQLKINASAGDIDNTLITEIRERKNEIIFFLENIKKQTKFSNIKPAIQKEYYEASSAQKRMYILQKIDPLSTSYNISNSFKLKVKPSKDKLQHTFNILSNRHEILRTSLHLIDDILVQKVNNEINIPIEYYEVSSTEANKIFLKFNRPFDLNKCPFIRAGVINIENKDYYLIIDMHHIISDGLSMQLFINELLAVYGGKELPQLKLQYKDYTEWQKQFKSSLSYKELEKYWFSQLNGEIPSIDLPLDFERPKIKSYDGENIKFCLTKDQTKKFKDVAKEHDITLFTLILCIYNIFLSKISNQDDVLIGVHIAGRDHADLDNILGIFINTLVLRNFPQGDKLFKSFLTEVKNNYIDALNHKEYQFDDLVEKIDLKGRDITRNPIFDVSLTYNNFFNVNSTSDTDEENVSYDKGIEIFGNSSKFDIDLIVDESDKHIFFTFQYCTKLFKRESILNFEKYFKNLIIDICSNPDKRIKDLSILSEKQIKELTSNYINLSGSWQSFTKLFEQQVTLNKNNIAVKFRDKTLTYDALNKRSNQLARYLRKNEVGRNSIVGIETERSFEMMIGILAILKAGGAYLPIDIDYPEERIEFMLSNSKCKIVLKSENSKSLDTKDIKSVNYADYSIYKDIDDSDLGSINEPDDLFYLIYTSGSTGQPKAVMVKHKSFSNLIEWYKKLLRLNTCDKILLIAPISFDLAQKNLFTPLISGACLYVFEPGVNYTALSNTIESEEINIINCSPSAFYPLVEISRKDNYKNLQSLKYVILGGENIQMDYIKPWSSSDFYNCQIINTYGPTECTDIASFYCIDNNILNSIKTIPIGKSIPNVSLYVLDQNERLLPPRVVGELYIGGIGISKGYLNNNDLTNERFVKIIYEDQLVYKSGDLVRYLSDGNIEFVKRNDSQVKIRGNRIEIGEIERAVLKFPGIEKTVITIKKIDYEQLLCAYYVASEKIIVADLRAYLAKMLPHYMIPSYFIEIDTIPLSVNGKINTQALPLPNASNEDIVQPANDTETKLRDIWCEVLRINKDLISMKSNFFEIGGQSLRAIHVISLIKKHFNLDIELAKIFEFQTIRSLSDHIDALTWIQSGNEALNIGSVEETTI